MSAGGLLLVAVAAVGGIRQVPRVVVPLLVVAAWLGVGIAGTAQDRSLADRLVAAAVGYPAAGGANE